MSAAAIQNQLLDRAYELSPDQFEVLCKVVIADSLQTNTLSVTPSSHDGGIDIEGQLSHEWVPANFGVQVKRYADGNRVSSDRVHRLAGALEDNNHHLGTVITTSSYTGPAVDAAERLPIKLVSGDDLAQAMVENNIGVKQVGGDYELAPSFWQNLGEADEEIPAGEVPLGSNFDRIRAVLVAMKHTNGTKPEIQAWVASEFNLDLSDRHVFINANSAAVMGLARKEPHTGQNTTQRWGLTETGAEFVTAEPRSPTAQQVLATAIRQVDLVEHLLAELGDAGELALAEITAVIEQVTTGLSESSVKRRSSAVRSWLEQLPEVQVDGGRTSKTYVYDPTGSGVEQSGLDQFNGNR